MQINAIHSTDYWIFRMEANIGETHTVAALDPDADLPTQLAPVNSQFNASVQAQEYYNTTTLGVWVKGTMAIEVTDTARTNTISAGACNIDTSTGSIFAPTGDSSWTALEDGCCYYCITRKNNTTNALVHDVETLAVNEVLNMGALGGKCVFFVLSGSVTINGTTYPSFSEIEFNNETFSVTGLEAGTIIAAITEEIV